VSAKHKMVETVPIVRRLSAIVIADVAGYTRLMERNDAGTFARLQTIRGEIVDQAILAHGGRIVRTTGDGILAEFSNVLAALRASVQIQREMATRNTGVAAEERIDYRIGVALGDIMIAGTDIEGDGVNVAARLQTLAEPGGICVSSAVRDQVHGQMDVGFVDMGAQQVKNMVRPIAAFHVELESRAPGVDKRRRWWHLLRGLGWRWVAAGVFFAIVAALVALWELPPLSKTAPVTRPTAALVAVLPFSDSAGGAGEQKVAAALAADLASGLGRSARWAKVVSGALSRTYQGDVVDARHIGRDLGVRYLVEGEVRRVDKQGMIKLQVVDADSATVLWNGDRAFDYERFAQEAGSVVASLTRQVYLVLFTAEMRRAAADPESGASAVDFTWHGWSVLNRGEGTVTGALEARKWFDKALRLDPSLVLALRGRWRTLQYEYDLAADADRSHLMQEMDELSYRATSIDENDSHAWWDRAETLARLRRWDAALEANARAQNLDPSFGGPFNQRAKIMIYMGKPLQALAIVDEELARDPEEPSEVSAAMEQRCRASLALGRYGDAIAACEKVIALANWWLPNAYLLAAYTQTGDAADAAAAKANALRLRPGLSIADLKDLWYSDNRDFIDQTEKHLLAGLRKAGIPER